MGPSPRLSPKRPSPAPGCLQLREVPSPTAVPWFRRKSPVLRPTRFGDNLNRVHLEMLSRKSPLVMVIVHLFAFNLYRLSEDRFLVHFFKI